MKHFVAFASILMWLAGCNASPVGPVADLKGYYDAPITPTGEDVIVQPVAVLAGNGGVFIVISVEGPSENAMWIAGALAYGIYFFRAPDLDQIQLFDATGPVRLRAPREQYFPPGTTVLYADPTFVCKEDQGQARLCIEVPARCRVPRGTVRVELSEQAIMNVLARNAGHEQFVRGTGTSKRLEAVEPNPVRVKVKVAELQVTPQPSSTPERSR